MQYRHFGSLDYQPSALGFGAMRLPLLPPDSPNTAPDFTRIDRPAATSMLHWAVDHGVNYVDTGWDYHRGASEPWLANALSGGYRERVKLATKLPVWMVESVADCDSYLDRQLERLNTPSIDFYLFHALERVTWRKAYGLGALEWAQRAKADGRIGHIGFSFHDDYDIFTEIVDAGEGVWEFCQIQLNYMDVEHQAGLCGLRYAAGHGLGVIVMEPVRGGRLAKEPPPAVDDLWKTAPRHRSRAEWALQWVWNLPEVSLALSGMNTMEQVQQNVEYAGRSAPGSLSAEELVIVDRVREAYREHLVVDCTGCRYCQPCPNGVDIPRILELYNDASIYDQPRRERHIYNSWVVERADACAQCGECESRCPQRLAVAEWLQRAHELLSPSDSEEPWDQFE